MNLPPALAALKPAVEAVANDLRRAARFEHDECPSLAADAFRKARVLFDRAAREIADSTWTLAVNTARAQIAKEIEAARTKPEPKP